MTACFITGTGTDIGKTYVTARMIRDWRTRGIRARALKPVASGYDPAAPESSDAGILLAAMGDPVMPETVEKICPWRYRAPLSPDMAAAREGRAIPFGDLIAFCRREIARTDSPLLIEGVGGVIVPLDDRHTVRDWITALDIPVILVAGTYLGTISHTLTAVEALTMRGIDIKRIILNASPDAPVPPEETKTTLSRFLPGTPIQIIERDTVTPG